MTTSPQEKPGMNPVATAPFPTCLPGRRLAVSSLPLRISTLKERVGAYNHCKTVGI